jgi:hypothetical protein
MVLITSPDVSAHLWPGQMGGAGLSMEGRLTRSQIMRKPHTG